MFDAEFFSIPPSEARMIDPQQRLLLETAWHTLENAGWDPTSYKKRVGVFVGTSLTSYFIDNIRSLAELPESNAFAALIANGRDFAATRIAYKLNLHGPAINVSTACSTSLTAVHLAVQALRDGHCEMALAGGATVHPQQVDGYIYEEGAILSPDGHCRAFDADAKGTVGGNGVVLVLLKPLDEAIRDGDNIYAVIKGTAINNDGGDKIGFTAPSIKGQAEVIRLAQKDAGVQPESISYIEGHGTGTVLGDSIEISALREVLGNNSEERSCALGSVKTNLGHLDTVAGIAGLLKTSLALYHGIIPKTLHFQKPNEQLTSSKVPFYVNNSTQAWQTGQLPRRAGVSSFGIGGTNVHVILEEPPRPVLNPSGRSLQIIPLSAKSEKALRKLSDSMAEFLENNSGLELADVAFTLAKGRKTFDVRRALVAGSFSDSIKKLRSDYQSEENPPRELAFMFTGQGSQYVGMGKGLLKESVFYNTVKQCADILKPHLNLDIRDVIWADSASADANNRLTSTRFAQPALFIIEYALAKQWMHWGIIPDAMIGHSIGEWVAACISGVLSLDDSLHLVALRGELMDRQSPGKMLAVSISEKEIAEYLSPELSLAAINSPRQCVISGSEKNIDELTKLLNSKNISNSKINTSHAFHSDMMTPVLTPFIQAVAEVKRSVPKIPFISNSTGNWITDEEAVSPEYWARHLRETVRFADGLTTLLEKENLCLLEIGAKKVLANLALQSPDYKKGHLVFYSMSDLTNNPDFDNLAETIAGIWTAGFDIDWDAFYEHEKRQRIPLPTYPFERQRYWIETIRGNGITQKPDDMNNSKSSFEALVGEMRNHEAALWQTMPIRLVADTPEFIALVNKLCSAYVLRMIAGTLPGIGPGDRFDIDMLVKSLNAPSSLHRLLKAHLRMIEEDGLVRHGKKGYTLLVNPSLGESPETLLDKGRISFPDFEKELLFINHCAGQNEAVLKGEVNALEVLFPIDGYSSFESSRLDEHHIYIRLAQQLLEQMLRNIKGAKLRVLEVGGGSGMLTEAMLPVLSKGNVEYMFTDISSNFTNAAQKRFNSSALKYGILDISRDPIEQGYTVGSFDLILALNVIHATPDLRHTLSNLRVLMSTGSNLCIIEEVRPRRWNDMCWGLTEGWWLYTDTDLRQHSPLISLIDWKELLRSSGFNQSTAFPEAAPLISRSDCGMILAVKGEESVVKNKAKTEYRSSINKTVEEPENDIERHIVQAMSEVLGLTSLGRRDSFFSLGGDSLLALQLCSRLKRDYDIELPHAAVLQSPTPAQLATKIIAKQDSAPDKNYLSGSGGIIRLRKGNSETPSLFLVHPVGGGVLCYRDLLSFLTPARSVYGLQSFGLTDSTPPLESIDIMAKYYVKAICDLPVSPAGRVLAGHSFGGLVAFEMARLLDKKGEKPLMTVLIDTPGPGHMPRIFQHDDEFMAYMLVGEDPDKEWDTNLRLIKSLPKKQRLGYVLKRIKQSLPDPDQVKDEVFLRYLDVTRSNINAMDTYNPEKWDVNILFFKAQEVNKFSALTPEKAWDDLAQGGVEVVNVPGNHISMLSKPNVAFIGNELEKRLNAIPSGKSISNETE